jgi:hypothetical protein
MEDVSKYFHDRLPPAQPGEGNLFLPSLVEREMAKGRMPVIGNHSYTPRDGRPAPRVVGDDPQLLAATAHVRKPQERMGEFFARTGLSAAQIRVMSPGEISKFVETVSCHEDYSQHGEM